MKYLILSVLLIFLTSCGADIAEMTSVTSSVTETTTVSSESITEPTTATTTAKTTTTAPPISTYETTTTVYNPLRNAVELNDVFYFDRDKSIIYLVIDGEITDQIEVADAYVIKDSIYFRSAESYSTDIGVFLPNNRVYFNIPTAIVVENKFYIADETKIKELKFLIDGKELELKYGPGPDYEEVLKLSDTSFIQYIRPDYVINAEELSFEGKVTFAYNPDTLTFEGEVWHNDKTAEAIAKELNDNAYNLTHIRRIPTEYSFTISQETRVGDKSKLVKFDGYNGYYSKSTVEGYRTADEYMKLLKSIYTDETAEVIFNSMFSPPVDEPLIIEKNGELYFSTREYLQTHYDDSATYYYDVFSVSENKIEARYVSFHGHEHIYHYNIDPYNLILENTENGWRISQEEYDWWNGLA
jgi:hypothetical protein